jgi:hypothetical protein
MWIQREISQELRALAKTFPALVLIGPRQVGKTSILERSFADHAYVSLDAGTLAESAETRPEEFLTLHPPPVLLDEIQYAPSFGRGPTQPCGPTPKHRSPGIAGIRAMWPLTSKEISATCSRWAA